MEETEKQQKLDSKLFYRIKFSNKEQIDVYPIQTGSFLSTMFFIIFSTLGSGIIILPITMKALGVIPSTLMLISAALISYFTLHELVYEAFKNNLYYFSDLIEKKYGKNIVIIVDICFHVGNLLGVAVFNKVSK